MRIVSKLGVSLFAVALLVGFSAGKTYGADEKKDTGSIKATVTGKDGKPAANIAVRVIPPQAKKPAAAAKSADGTVLVAAGNRPTPVAEGTTNDKGVAEIKDVPVGDYTVVSGSKDAGQGRANVTVKKGETAEVSITLKDRAAPAAK